jgi:hypothetical protein
VIKVKWYYTKLRSDIAIAIRALSPSPVPNWERGADRRGEGSTIFDCNLVLVCDAKREYRKTRGKRKDLSFTSFLLLIHYSNSKIVR